MEAALLLEVASPPYWSLAVDATACDADAVGFEPADAHQWRTITPSRNRVTLTVWRGRNTDGFPWCERPGVGITALVGHLRRRGRSWPRPAVWANDLWSFGATPSAGVIEDDLAGIFAAVSITRDGNGWLAADPLGFRCLYRSGNSGHLVVSSRAALAAVGGAAPNAPTRDPNSAVWLAATSYHVGSRSGFANVSIVTPGTVLRLDAGEPSWHPSPNAPSPPTPQPVQELAAELVDDVGESLKASLDLPASRKIINLTGGKDSRKYYQMKADRMVSYSPKLCAAHQTTSFVCRSRPVTGTLGFFLTSTHSRPVLPSGLAASQTNRLRVKTQVRN